VYGVESALRRGGHTDLRRFHLPDEQTVVERELEQILDDHDVLLLSGGVSAGQHDFIPGALQKLGVRPVFHKILQRPGLPFWFGVAEGNKQVFAMPGNPVSTLISFYRYVIPQLAINAGSACEPEFAALSEEYRFKKDLTLFLPVRLGHGDDGTFVAEPKPTHGSGDFSGLAPTDGFIELPADEHRFARGSTRPLYRWS
jgi:molybdopterin molybdotransferase